MADAGCMAGDGWVHGKKRGQEGRENDDEMELKRVKHAGGKAQNVNIQ